MIIINAMLMAVLLPLVGIVICLVWLWGLYKLGSWFFG